MKSALIYNIGMKTERKTAKSRNWFFTDLNLLGWLFTLGCVFLAFSVLCVVTNACMDFSVNIFILLNTAAFVSFIPGILLCVLSALSEYDEYKAIKNKYQFAAAENLSDELNIAYFHVYRPFRGMVPIEVRIQPGGYIGFQVALLMRVVSIGPDKVKLLYTMDDSAGAKK